MTVQEKLKLIQALSGLKQAELANRLGVTFATLNRWINGHAIPRKSALEKINKLYLEYSDVKSIAETVENAKVDILLVKYKTHANVLREILDNPDVQDQFLLSLTYNSNRIEGSTLSEEETAAVLFQNAALPNKTLSEQIEAKNHRAAIEYIFDKEILKKPITQELILKLHSIVMNALKPDAGSYRNHGVRIAGSFVPTANHLKIPELMRKLVEDMNTRKGDIVARTAELHARFEQIHPFSDGNGRVGRLLMAVMLLRNNFPPAVVRQEHRRFYYNCLSKAQTKNNSEPLINFIRDAVIEGYKILERK